MTDASGTPQDQAPQPPQTTPPQTPQTPPPQTPQTPPPTTFNEVRVTRAEVMLLVLFALGGMSIWLLVGLGLSSLMKALEPREESELVRHEVPWKKDSLAMTQGEQQATQKQLVEVRLNLTKLEAELAAFDALPPAATPTPTPSPSPSPAKSDEAPKREEIAMKREAAARHTKALMARLKELQQVSNEQREEVEDLSSRAAVTLGAQRVAYRFAKAVLTLFLTGVLLRVLYVFMRRRMAQYETAARAGGYEPNSTLLLQAVGGLLLVLIGYEAFGVAGASVAGAVLLLLVLAKMKWPVRAPAGGKAK